MEEEEATNCETGWRNDSHFFFFDVCYVEEKALVDLPAAPPSRR